MYSKLFSNKLSNLNSLKKYFSTSKVYSSNHSCKVLIVGGGTGGCATAAKFARVLNKNELIVLEPSDVHYYQPMFTLIGAGICKVDESRKFEKDVLPKNATWIKDAVGEFQPKDNLVVTAKGDSIKYDLLLIAVGLETHYEKIPGLLDALSIPNGKVGSNYSAKYVDRTYTAMKNFKEGNAIFTYPTGPVKCPGAPQKICYLAEHNFRQTNKRDKAKIYYNTSLPVIFGVKRYADALWKVVKSRDINVNLQTNLIEIRPDKDEAVFQNLEKPDNKTVMKYSMLHVTPPMSTPEPIRKCKELVNEAGMVDVNKDTLQHVKYKNVFAVGDCSSSPNSKTAAAAAAQCNVVFNNMKCALESKPNCMIYDGYASCPLVTSYNTCILAEFDYDLQPLETFPFSQDRELRSMYLLKKVAMPVIYWNLMMNGYWNGPAVMRKMLHLGMK